METIYHNNSGFYFNKKINIQPHQEMNLISLGTRKKYMLVMYGAALYTYPEIKKISDIFRPVYTKCIQLKFYRSLDYENMYKSLVDTISKRIQLYKIKKELNQMYTIFKNIRFIENSDVINILWYSDTIEFTYNNIFVGRIKNNSFAEAIYNCYLDENSITPDILNDHQNDIVNIFSNLNL